MSPKKLIPLPTKKTPPNINTYTFPQVSNVTSPLLRISLTTLVLAALCIGSGCTRFGRAWHAAQHPNLNAKQDSTGFEGQWIGHWRSDVNGHTGTLRCAITQTSDNHFQAFFRARYLRILQFSYPVTLTIRNHQGTLEFEGKSDLGKLAGGVYSYVGTARTNHFQATYTSTYDHGVFEMERHP